MKEVNLILIMAFALMITLGSLNGVLADEYVCFASEIGSEYQYTDSNGKVYGYQLSRNFADDESAIFAHAHKSTTDQVIFKFDPSNMNIITTYDIDESAISNNYFGLNALTHSNESGSPVLYGYNESQDKLYQYDITSGVTSTKFSTYDISGSGNELQGIAINKDGDSTDAPTELIITTSYGGSGLLRVWSCTWENSPTCTLKKEYAPDVYDTYSDLDYQQDDVNQEIVIGKTLRATSGNITMYSLDDSTYNQINTKDYSMTPPTSTYIKFISGVAHVGGTNIYVSYDNGVASPSASILKTFTPCETIDAGVFVSVNEFDNANNAKATNEGTDFAVYDEEATLGWQAHSFIDTLNDFDGEYSIDSGAFTDIIGLQSIGDADAGYEYADLSETFTTTIARDAGNTTANWDIADGLAHRFHFYDEFDIGLDELDENIYSISHNGDGTISVDTLASTGGEIFTLPWSDTTSVDTYVSNYKQDVAHTSDNDKYNTILWGSNAGKGISRCAWINGDWLTYGGAYNKTSYCWYNGSWSCTQQETYGTSTYKEYKIVKTSAIECEFYLAGSLIDTKTVTSSTDGAQIAFAGSYPEDFSVDYIKIYDSSDVSSEKITTLELDSTGDTISKFNLAVTDTTPTNTNITYDVSCNGGSDWATDITTSIAVACDTNGNDLRIRANLTTTDGDLTPTLDNFGINYTTDGSDPTTPGVFEHNYYSYVWDTTTLSNGQYKFKMTATDDDSPPNTDDATSQEFTICHGDTLQVYLSPDYSTDLYTSTACTNTVTIDVNSTDEIIIKAVNQDSSNPQSLTLNIENSLNDDRFYDVYTSSDGTTWASTPDIDLTRKELKTWTGTTWNHAQTDELSTSETKYYKYVYRKPYAVVTTDIEGYESLIPDDSKIDLWNVALGDIRFNDQTCIDLLGGSHCTSFVGQSSYSTGAIESTDKLSMVASSTAFDIMLVAKYEITTPGIPKLHVQAKSDLGDSWGDVFVSLNGATAIATGVPMTTTWANYSASMTADSYVRIYIEEGSGAVSDVHMSQIYVVPNKYFTGAPIFRKADGSILDMQPGGDSSSNSEYYLSEGDDFSVHVEYYDKEGVIDTAQIVINKTGSADIVKTVNVTISPTIEYLYTGDLALGGFIDTSDTVTEITGIVYLLDNDSSEFFKTTEDVLFRQFPYGAGDYKSGFVIDTGSQFVGRAPKGSVSIQMTRTNPLAKVRMRIWDTDTNGTFSEASSNFVKDFIKGTDFVCSYNDCSFSFDLTDEWVWSNDGKFFVQLEPFFSTSGTQPYTDSFLTVPIIISQSSYQHMTLTFLDSAMDRETRHSDLIGDATSDYRDLIAVNNNETKNFMVRLKTSDGANVVGDINVYLALFKYGSVNSDATKGNGTPISEDISAGGVLETTCRAEASEDDCIAISGCEWFTSGTPNCSTISAPISYYKHEFNAYTGINYFYFSTPLLDESGAFLNNSANYGLFAYASDQTFTDETLTGKYGHKKVVLSQYIPSDMAVPYSTNSLYYVQKPISVDGLGAEGICVNQDGLEVGGGGCAGISEDWEAFCDKDGILGTFTGVYRPGKFRCTWGEQDDQFCDMYETCEVPLLVTSDYAASRPFIYAFACTDPVTGYYSPQCVWAIRGGDTPITQVDYLIWNDNTNWEESNPDYQQWVEFSIPYEELSEVDINATYIAQLADGPLTMASAAESLFLSAGGVAHTLICGWGFILSFGANNCNEITINMDTDTLIGTIVNGVQFININDYQQLVKRYEAGFSTSEQCSAVGYTWDSTAGRCYSSVDPTDALKYAGENDISINKSNWFASTYYNQSTQASYNGQTAIIIDNIPSSDTNTTLKIPVNFTMRIWWNDGGEMKSEQRTMKQIVPVNYTNTTACGNYNTLGGWYDKFACLTVDVTTLVTDFFFFFLIMIVLASIIFGAIRATRGR